MDLDEFAAAAVGMIEAAGLRAEFEVAQRPYPLLLTRRLESERRDMGIRRIEAPPELVGQFFVYASCYGNPDCRLNVEGKNFGEADAVLEFVRRWLIEAVPHELVGIPLRGAYWHDAEFRPLEQAKQWIRDTDKPPMWHLAAAMKLATSREPELVSVDDLLECVRRGGPAAAEVVPALSRRICSATPGSTELGAIQAGICEALHANFGSVSSFAELGDRAKFWAAKMLDAGQEVSVVEEDATARTVGLTVTLDDAHRYHVEARWEAEGGARVRCEFVDHDVHA